MTLVRLITFRSAILRQMGKDLVLTPVGEVGVLYLRSDFQRNGHAMLFSTAVASERAGPLRKKRRERQRRARHDQQPAGHLPPSAHGRDVS
jgi:hypothetical protein